MTKALDLAMPKRRNERLGGTPADKARRDQAAVERIRIKICKALEPLRLVEKYRAGHPEDIATAIGQRIEALRREFDSSSPGANLKRINRAAKKFRAKFHAFKTRDGKFVDLLKQTFPGWDIDTPDGRQRIGPYEVIDRQLEWLASAPGGRNATFDEPTFNDAFIAHMLIVEFSQEAPTGNIKGSLHAITAYVQELRTSDEPKPANLKRAVYAVRKFFESYSIP
jgi:hypothetical protein